MSDLGFTHLAWMDLETDGLDLKGCRVLEVGLVLTDLQFVELAWFDALAFEGTLVDFRKMKAAMPDVVKAMHRDNRLLHELEMGLDRDMEIDLISEERRPVYTYAWIDAMLDSIFNHGGIEKGKLILAGSGSSRFDRPIIARVFPRAFSYLHYADIDVGILRRFLKIIGVEWMIPTDETKAHRAMTDVVSHLDQARSFGDFLIRAATTNKENAS